MAQLTNKLLNRVRKLLRVGSSRHAPMGSLYRSRGSTLAFGQVELKLGAEKSMIADGVTELQANGPTVNWERIRADFPILGRTVHGKPLVYLDSTATSQKPQAV